MKIEIIPTTTLFGNSIKKISISADFTEQDKSFFLNLLKEWKLKNREKNIANIRKSIKKLRQLR